MKVSQDSIKLGLQEFSSTEVDYNSYSKVEGSIVVGDKTYSATMVEGKEEFTFDEMEFVRKWPEYYSIDENGITVLKRPSPNAVGRPGTLTITLEPGTYEYSTSAITKDIQMSYCTSEACAYPSYGKPAKITIDTSQNVYFAISSSAGYPIFVGHISLVKIS